MIQLNKIRIDMRSEISLFFLCNHLSFCYHHFREGPSNSLTFDPYPPGRTWRSQDECHLLFHPISHVITCRPEAKVKFLAAVFKKKNVFN